MNWKRAFACLSISFIVISLMCSLNITRAMGEDLTPKEELGKALFFDRISSPDSMSCAACHAPSTGFTGPVAGINLFGSVYRGAVPQRFGNRKPPSAAYATFSPVFHYDADEGLFVGGNFWDGRATGEVLGNPAADQALGPFLNPVEQNNPSKKAVLEQVAASQYANLWEEVWGELVSYETEADIEANYDRIGLSIAAYEASSEVNQFSSKYDLSLSGDAELTEQEAWGLELFEGKGMCSACHPSEPGSDGEPPLFTDFTFDNLGTPKNPDNPFYKMDKVYLDDGTPINPDGADWIDEGLGGFLKTLDMLPEWQALADENMGKHKVPTLRNVDKRPGLYFPKAYLHNGVFKSLKEVVHFYNTRDVEDWPEPEVPENVNTDELGNLGLTDAEENAIVAFLKTLSDGYTPRGQNRRPLFVNILSSTSIIQLNSEISAPRFLSNIGITNETGNNNGNANNGNGHVFTGPPWKQAEVNGPPWYLNGLTWFKNDSGGAWWWKASLLVTPVGPVWYQNGSNGPPWYQDPVSGPWWASALL
ncbi:MAG: cytochrome-c peroxidase [bacterium]